MPTYAVGDIQGCFEPLQRLMASVDFSPARDRLWLVGDLVNRGPQSTEVLRWVKGLGDRAVTVLGNHDLHLLSQYFGQSSPGKRDTLAQTLNARDVRELVEWLLGQPFLVTEGERSLVHAGVLPQWTLEESQDRARVAEAELRKQPEAFLKRIGKGAPPHPLNETVAVLTRLRTCTPQGVPEPSFDGPPESAPPGYAPWFSQPTRRTKGHTFVFGHWAALGLSRGPDWLGVDTGCVWGNRLTAVRLEDGQVTQVPATLQG